MKRIANNSGFTILEALLGMTILGVMAAAFMAFQHQTSKSMGVVADQGALARLLITIEKDIMADMAFIPPQDEEAPSTTSTDPNSMKFYDSPTFRDPEKAGERCYDKTGSRMPSCANFGTAGAAPRFRVQFFSVRVQDRNFMPASRLSHIPLSRVRFRVEAMIDNKVAEPMFFSRIKTYAMVY